MRVAVIGGGAAGFFAAIQVKENHPNVQVDLFEKSNKLLSKVRISGGGRCNVTNVETSIPQLIKAYPRGGKQLKKAFNQFSTEDTVKWFENKGIALYAQDDGRMFPSTNDSQTIVDCLYNQAKKTGIKIFLKSPINKMTSSEDGFNLTLAKEAKPYFYNKVIIATGGAPKMAAYEWLKTLGHTIVPPVPSLFTFNVPNNPITKLMGVSVPTVKASLIGTKSTQEGPILITHWGLSGPAILKLSAYSARVLRESNYQFEVGINWANEKNQNHVLEVIQEVLNEHPKKQISNIYLFNLPKRLFHFLLAKCEIPLEKPAAEIGKKQLNKLSNILTNDVYPVKGKTTFKEEFVTSGGVDLNGIDIKTMQSKIHPNLYFAGEVLNIDAITGGYNFQAAWTTGFIAGKLGT